MTIYCFSTAEVNAATDAALECLAWTTPVETEDGDDSAGYLNSGDYEYSEDARRIMRDTVAGFMTDDTVTRLFHLLELLGTEFSADQIGHDFILTANGHGAGFWDRDYRPRQRAVLKAISELATPYGEIIAYITATGEIGIDA